jgi:hypothetical protein
LSAGFSLGLADHSTLADGKAVTLTNGAGQTATVELVTAFRVDRPDPALIYRNTHLYGIALAPFQPASFLGPQTTSLYIDDAGNNAVWTVSLNAQTSPLFSGFPGFNRTPNTNPAAGTPQLVVRFPNIVNATGTVPPASEAVPTSVHVYGNRLLVTLLSGAPFIPTHSSVVSVDPKTGTVTPLVQGLSSTIDALYRHPSLQEPSLLILEYSTNLATGATGQLLLWNGSGTPQVIAGNLSSPAAMALDEASGTLYIADRTDGQILKLSLP